MTDQNSNSDREPNSGLSGGPGNDPIDKLDVESRQGTGFLSVLKSVLAAGFGVQSGENRERDFKHGKATHFIIGGVLGTLVFIVVIVLVVKILLATSSA